MCWVESNHKNVIVHNDGGDGTASYGVCQIKLQTAREMGFTGKPADLLKPHLNTYFAGQYLAYQMKRYHGDVKKAVKAYNLGHFRGMLNCRYVRKVMKAYQEGR